jgi:hypothetical protein
MTTWSRSASEWREGSASVLEDAKEIGRTDRRRIFLDALAAQRLGEKRTHTATLTQGRTLGNLARPEPETLSHGIFALVKALDADGPAAFETEPFSRTATPRAPLASASGQRFVERGKVLARVCRT